MATKSTETQQNVRKKRKKSKKGSKRIILFVIEMIILVVLLIVLYGVLKVDKVDKIAIDKEDIVVNEHVVNNVELKGYRNIALFGVDSRDQSLGKGNRTDTIMIASLNADTKEVKLLSVYRDTYLNLGNDKYNKCNGAYAQGGPEQAINMLNMNLDLNIEDYITIGFTGLIDVIDAIGGVEINVLEEEIRHLNNYQISMVGTSTDGKTFVAQEGKDYIPVTTAGPQTLNGLQATAYCRIRYVGDDFMRTQRQRDVLSLVLEKAKTVNPTTLNKILDKALPNVSTSLDIDEMVEVLSEVSQYSIVGNDGFPFEEYRSTGNLGGNVGSAVIPVDLQANVRRLHQFLFNANDYELSEEVITYSQKISADTGR
ncbi:MAG: LCP family protein [Lachnospiraceae bacterium]|nr:LCP family protein [Lachnospiraceae bacterium]